MKIFVSIVFAFFFFAGCNTSKPITTSKNIVKEAPDETGSLSIEITEPTSSFIWKKKQYLHIYGVLINSGDAPITILQPYSNSQTAMSSFSINISEGFTGNSCIFEAGESIYPSSEDFFTIPAGEQQAFGLSGYYYMNQYCNDEPQKLDSVEISIVYYGNSQQIDSESYIIQKNYKTSLTPRDSTIINESIASSIKRRYSSLTPSEQEIKRKDLFKAHASRFINTTEEEQASVINLLNSRYPHKVYSDTVRIAIEK